MMTSMIMTAMMLMKTRAVLGEQLVGLPPVTGSNERVNVDVDNDDDKADDDDNEDVNVALHCFTKLILALHFEFSIVWIGICLSALYWNSS